MTEDTTTQRDLALKFASLFDRLPASALVGNLNAQIATYQIGNNAVPISRSDGPNCYICSPTIAYIDYAIEETRNFATHPVLQTVLLSLIKACRPLIRATGLDYQVQPNNWLFSTNPVPALSGQDAETLRDDLKHSDPERAIVIRSLNPVADTGSIAALRSAGFLMLPSRQIYIYDAQNDTRITNDAKRDSKLLEKTDYDIVPASAFSAGDFTRAAALYNMLYLDKYTALNPQYTAQYLTEAHQIGLLQLIGLRGPDGQLDGITGLFDIGNTLTMPMVGYDTGKPQKRGLYRMLNAIGHSYALRHQKLYNMSAGAAAFKRFRGAKPTIEYTAVYVAHLGLRARLATHITKTLLDLIGVPILRKFEL